MENNRGSLELEQMRSQLSDFKAMLKQQNIVNERIMRRAMAKDYSQIRREIVAVIAMSLVAVPILWWLMPQYGLPGWFITVTIAFILISVLASCFSLYRYASDDLLGGNLTEVAGKMIGYKRFGNNWLKFSIPFLAVWLVLFFYFASSMTGTYGYGIIVGGITGGLIGGALGVRYRIKSDKRIAQLLNQIEEVKGLQAEQ